MKIRRKIFVDIKTKNVNILVMYLQVKYCKSEIDRRMIMPTLVQKQTRAKTLKTESLDREEEEKENDEQRKKGELHL